MENLEFFLVNSSKYVNGTSYEIVRPASINNPKDNAVMFITEGFMEHVHSFDGVAECLIFWPQGHSVPDHIKQNNAVVCCANPHLEYCLFFADNHITDDREAEEYNLVNGAYIAKKAKIGANTIVLPGAFICGDVEIGKNCYIGAGVKIVSRARIGNNVKIRENAVIGTEGLTTDRDENGHPIYMPQFGGVIIEDSVTIGTHSLVQRGAIDDTIIKKGCKIDTYCVIAHNCIIGEESFIVGMTDLLGSSSVGRQAHISAGCVVGNYVHIGDGALLGMSSLANKDIPNNCVAFGIPAKVKRYS